MDVISPVSAIADIASELLGADINADSDLFDAGATSITVIVLVGRARRAVGDALTPATVLQGRTPREIVRLAALPPDDEPASAPAAAASRIGTASDDSRATRSPRWVTGLPITQYRMWFIEQRFPGAGDSAAPVLFRIRGPLDVDAMRRAVEFLVLRHEALRTKLVCADGKHVDPQVVATNDEAIWSVQDWFDEALEAFLWTPFDLNRELPVRARLFRDNAHEHVLALVVHHTAYDGWSDGVLCRDISAAYAAYAAGAEPVLPPALGFHAAARLQTERAEPGADEFWLDHLRGVPDIPLGAAPGSSTGTVREIPVQWPDIETDVLRAACSRLGATTTAVYLAAWILALREETGADDFAVGMPLAGRTVREAENVIGCFASSAILRFPDSVPSGPDCVRHSARLLERAMTDQFLPLERMFFALRPEETGRNPFCQVGFVMQNNEHDPLTLPGLDVARMRARQRTSIFEMALVLWPGSISGSAEFGNYVWYRDDVVSRDRAERLARRWPAHVAHLCADRGATIDEGCRR
jgi:mycobactin peptide synthetase MbtE